ncbi:Hypothetical predicted protein, partial [Olea europaea subsp. europaea]
TLSFANIYSVGRSVKKAQGLRRPRARGSKKPEPARFVARSNLAHFGDTGQAQASPRAFIKKRREEKE